MFWCPPMLDLSALAFGTNPGVWSLGVPSMNSHLGGLSVAQGSLARLLLLLGAVMQCPHLVLVAVRMF